MLSYAPALLAVLPLASAHFTLDWPTARGFDDGKAVNFPCGGFDSVSSSRTDFPINGGPVQLNMHHPLTNVKILLALGPDPGDNYNVVLRPTFTMEGLGDFCAGQISLPSGVNVSDGTEATLQVVTNGDPDGGLYQCADITLRTATLSQSEYDSNCKNGTKQRITQENISGNPNETSSGGGDSPSASPSPSQSPSGTAASASSTGLAAHQTAATWVMGAIGVAGFALL